jgi:hypothetical protein
MPNVAPIPVNGVGVQVLQFNPLDDKSRYPYRNRFEPHRFRVWALVFMALSYFTTYGIGVMVSTRHYVMLYLLPVFVALALFLYFVKPEYWVKVDRLSNQVELRLSRFGCPSSAPFRVFPVQSIRDVTAETAPCQRQRAASRCCCRCYTIMVHFNGRRRTMLLRVLRVA